MNDRERFWSKVRIGCRDECWPWLAGKDKDGYGKFRLNGKQERAHRVTFLFANGRWPLIGRHSCDYTSCVNPVHVLDGSIADNNHDAIARGRARKVGAKGDASGMRKHPEAVRRGEHSGMAKFTDAQIAEVLLAQGTRAEISSRFGISKVYISQLRHKKRRQPWNPQRAGADPEFA